MEGINPNKYYTIKQTAEILSLSPAVIKRKCHKLELNCSNIWNENRKIFRVQWEVILDYLK